MTVSYAKLQTKITILTKFRRSGKRLNYCRPMANLLTIFYQNRPGFVEDMTKTFCCVFRYTV